jgi:hypothetical protein
MREVTAFSNEVRLKRHYYSEADFSFFIKIDVIKQRQPNKREDAPIHRNIRGNVLSISLRKKIKIKQLMPVVIKAIGQRPPVSKSLSSIGYVK